MKPKKTISVRVSESVADKLTFMALKKGLNRQGYIENILNDLTLSIKIPGDVKMLYIEPSVFEQIENSFSNEKKGQEISLKKLIGDKIWNTFEDTTKRNFGKEFRVMVESGEFPELSLGKKKSNNEQQYNYDLN